MSETEQPPATGPQTRDPAKLRVPKYEGPEERAPIDVQRASSAPGGVLVRINHDSGPPFLAVQPGAAGEAEEQLGRADPAAALAAVESLDAYGPVRREMRARAALMGGDVAGARAAIGDDRTDSGLALADAMVSLAEGDLVRAATRLAQNAAGPGGQGIAHRYAWALVRVAEGDIGEAQTALTEVARSAPWHAVARYQLGQLLLATGDPARAGTLFEMSAIIAPRFVAPALTLAEMLADSRQYGEALSLVQGITERSPDAHAPRVLQLRVLLEIGEREAAMMLAQTLRERVPGDIDVALLYAEALAEVDRRAEASTVLEDVVGTGDAPVMGKQRAQRLRARIAMADRPPRADDALAILKSATVLDGPLTGELALEQFQVAWSLGKKDDAEAALDVIDKTDDASSLISGAILARSHALWPLARKLAEKARGHVMGTPAEAQLDGFLAGLPPPT